MFQDYNKDYGTYSTALYTFLDTYWPFMYSGIVTVWLQL